MKLFDKAGGHFLLKVHVDKRQLGLLFRNQASLASPVVAAGPTTGIPRCSSADLMAFATCQLSSTISTDTPLRTEASDAAPCDDDMHSSKI